jgi:hypothetical protein
VLAILNIISIGSSLLDITLAHIIDAGEIARMLLTTHLHSVLRLRLHGVLPPLCLYLYGLVHGHRENYVFKIFIHI